MSLANKKPSQFEMRGRGRGRGGGGRDFGGGGRDFGGGGRGGGGFRPRDDYAPPPFAAPPAQQMPPPQQHQPPAYQPPAAPQSLPAPPGPPPGSVPGVLPAAPGTQPPGPEDADPLDPLPPFSSGYGRPESYDAPVPAPGAGGGPADGGMRIAPPKEVRDGDWACDCGNVNFSFRRVEPAELADELASYSRHAIFAASHMTAPHGHIGLGPCTRHSSTEAVRMVSTAM